MKVGARSCKIIGVPIEQGVSFLKTNHRAGSVPYDFAYGLTYNGELVFLIAFLGNVLVRMGTKEGYRVVGGASRLFKHITTNHSFEEIISYCSAKNTGEVYYHLGFHLTKKNRKVLKFVWTFPQTITNKPNGLNVGKSFPSGVK